VAKRNKAETKRPDAKGSGTDEMSALDLLEEDHSQVEGLFEEYEHLEDSGEKEQVALKICMMLQLHAQVEEEIFYPAVREAIDKTELIDEAIVEHAAAKQLIAGIEEMDPGDELYDARVKVLGEQVRHHIEEEEDELFPEVEGSGLDLGALGKTMAERKAALLQQVADESETL
jgi:hemerythrin superfamily protein